MPRSSVDYATDNITVYRFCPYQCRYCWAWRLGIFRSRIERGKYSPIEEATRYLYKYNRVVVVSFTSDPYPPQEAEKQLTRKVLEVLALNRRNKVLILTKNPALALRDTDVMKKHGDMWLGTTITTIDDSAASDWEIKAPPPSMRLKALYEAKKKGVKIWLSIEPVIPGTTYPETIIRKTWYVDWYVLGAFNYVKQLGFRYSEDLRAWYLKHVKAAIKLLESLNKRYYIKKELRRYLQ